MSNTFHADLAGIIASQHAKHQAKKKLRFVVQAGVVIDTKYSRPCTTSDAFASPEAHARSLNCEQLLCGDKTPPPPKRLETLPEAAQRRNWTRCRTLLWEIGSTEAIKLAGISTRYRDFDRDEMLFEEHEALTKAIVAFSHTVQVEPFAEEGC